MAAGLPVFGSDFRLGPVARGRRIIASSVSTTVEIGVLRVDAVTLVVGRAYKVWTSPLNMKGSVVGDAVDVRLRVNEGGVATTSSTQVSHVRSWTNSAAFTPLVPIVQYYEPTGNTTVASFLLTVARVVTGTSSTGVQVNGSGTEIIDLVIEDIGLAVADTGVDL